MGKIAFVFPGQGAQAVGMGMSLYENSKNAKIVLDTTGEKIKKLTFEGPQENLNLTLNAQPCLFAVNLAAAAALNERDIFAEGIAGFSLGEISGLVHSGLLSLEQGLDYVNFRANAMHECALQNIGGMFAVMGLNADSVISLCAEVKGAFPANFNSAGQTVVACSEENTDALKVAVAKNGGKIIKLAASGAFHSPFMDAAKEKIEKYIDSVNFGSMTIPLYSNATAEIYSDPKTLTARQVNSPVLWQKTIEKMFMDGFDTFIEAGPGKTLTGLIQKINKNINTFNVYDSETLEKTIQLIGEKNA